MPVVQFVLKADVARLFHRVCDWFSGWMAIVGLAENVVDMMAFWHHVAFVVGGEWCVEMLHVRLFPVLWLSQWQFGRCWKLCGWRTGFACCITLARTVTQLAWWICCKCGRALQSSYNVTLLAFAAVRRAAAAPDGRRYRSISPARPAYSSKPTPTAAACSGRQTGQRDGQTDGHRTVTQILAYTIQALSKLWLSYLSKTEDWGCVNDPRPRDFLVVPRCNDHADGTSTRPLTLHNQRIAVMCLKF